MQYETDEERRKRLIEDIFSQFELLNYERNIYKRTKDYELLILAHDRIEEIKNLIRELKEAAA